MSTRHLVVLICVSLSASVAALGLWRVAVDPSVEKAKAAPDLYSCSGQCRHLSSSLVASIGGIFMPTGERPASAEPGVSEAIRELREILRPAGVLTGCTWEFALDHFDNQAATPILIVHPTGHFFLWLGTATDPITGAKYQKLVHGSRQPEFVPDTIFRHRFGKAAQYWMLPVSVRRMDVHFRDVHATFEGLVNDFGVVSFGDELDTVVTVTNVGSAPFWIDRPIASCACTMAEMPETQLVAPGQAVAIPLTYRTAQKKADLQRVYIRIKDQYRVVEHMVAGFVTSWQFDTASWDPKVLDFGKVNPLDEFRPVRVLRIKEKDTDRFEIASVTPSDDSLHPRRGRTLTVDGCRIYEIIVGLDAGSSSAGEYRGHLELATTSRRRSHVTIPVRWEVLPRVSIEPTAVLLDASQDAGVLVTVRSRAGGAIRVGSVDLPPGVHMSNKGASSGGTTLYFWSTRTEHFDGLIQLEVIGSGWKESIAIPCLVSASDSRAKA